MRSAVRAYVLPVFVALLLRLAVMPLTLPDQLDPARDHWHFGYEAGRLARSLAEGHGFASPLFGATGPSAWMTPAYPALLALLFKLFGIYTLPAAIAALTVNAMVSALTCVPIALMARECSGGVGDGDRMGRRAAWTWALFPYAIYFPMERMWETWLATLLLAVLLLAVLRQAGRFPVCFWLSYAVLWALAAYTSPSLCILLPVCVFFGVWRMAQDGRSGRGVRPVAGPSAFALLFVLLLVPWTARNYVVFHRLIPMRDSFATGLRMANPPEPYFHWAKNDLGPWHNDTEWREFQIHGELAYMDRLQRLATASIKAHPALFLSRTARRIVFLWTGFWSLDPRYLAEEPLDLFNIPFCTVFLMTAFLGLVCLWRRDRARGAFLLATLFVFPLTFYAVTPDVYLRRPLDAVMVVLCVYAFPLRATLPKLMPRSIRS